MASDTSQTVELAITAMENSSDSMATTAATNQTDSGVIRDSGGGFQDSLLWLPYLLLTMVLLGLVAASFIKYHHKNRGRYRGKEYARSLTQANAPKKRRVTLNEDGFAPREVMSPQSVASHMVRSTTPDLTRSSRFEVPLWRNPRDGKFVKAGYFLDKLNNRRKSMPLSMLQTYAAQGKKQSSIEDPDSGGSTGSQFNQSSVKDVSDLSAEVEMQNLGAPPVPPRNYNRRNLRKYMVNQPSFEADSGYLSSPTNNTENPDSGAMRNAQHHFERWFANRKHRSWPNPNSSGPQTDISRDVIQGLGNQGDPRIVAEQRQPENHRSPLTLTAENLLLAQSQLYPGQHLYPGQREAALEPGGRPDNGEICVGVSSVCPVLTLKSNQKSQQPHRHPLQRPREDVQH